MTAVASEEATTTTSITTPVTSSTSPTPTTTAAAATLAMTTMAATPPTTTPVPVCNCPAGSAGVIFPAGDSQYFLLPAGVGPALSATCGGCPNGLTKDCFQTTSSTFVNAISSIDVLCNDYTNFCACPSNGQPCFTFGQNNGVFDIQLYSVCDASSGVCQIYLTFFSFDNTDFITNGVQTVTYVQTTDGAGNQLNFTPTSPYPKSPTFAISCNGCGAVSKTGTSTGTSVTCTGPLTTNG